MAGVKAHQRWVTARPRPLTCFPQPSVLSGGRVHASPTKNTDIAKHAAITDPGSQLLDYTRAGA